MSGAKKPWRQEMPDFLQFLENPLGHPVRLHEEVLGYDLYFADLSDWKLRFSDRTPFIWVKAADVAALPPRELAQSLADVLRTRGLAERNPIVLVQGPGEELRGATQAFAPERAGARSGCAGGRAGIAAPLGRAAGSPERADSTCRC